MKTERLNLRISKTERKQLEALQKASNAANFTEVIRRALAAYEHLWNAKQGKCKILIRDPNGNETDLLLL